ncbi:4'-phosphopantetheinyl transferase family protein [Endozoicomonas sp.]|uniref:4'-phosphopantetheinyl transferase family protein n=1 Tax=Endozoicomonas sp. TaxID=1892382 RepID=UPI00383B9786
MNSVPCYLTSLLDIQQHYRPDESIKLLSPEELTQLAKITLPKSKARFLAGRSFIKHTLAQYLEIPAGDVRIETATYGKPYQQHQPNLFFNLSHTGNWFALAISRHGEIGIDIETHKPRKNLSSMAQQVFTKAEQRWFKALTGKEQEAMFYSLWSLKEAILKAEGIGLNLAMNQLGFSREFSASIWPEMLGSVKSWQWQCVSEKNLSLSVAIKRHARVKV